MNKSLQQAIYTNATKVQCTLKCSVVCTFPFVQREALYSLKIRINRKLSIRSNLAQNQTHTFFVFKTYYFFFSPENCNSSDLNDMVVFQSKENYSPYITFVDFRINSSEIAIFSIKLTKQLWRLKNYDSLNLKCKVAGEKILTLKIYSILKFYISFTKQKVKTKEGANLYQ